MWPSFKALEHHYSGNKNKNLVINYLGMKPTSISSLSDVDVIQSDDKVNLAVPATVPLTEDWL